MKLEDIKRAVIIWGAVSPEGISELKKESLVIIAENRPFLLGLKHNIPLLKGAGINFLYCADNVLGFLLYKDKIKKTYLFYREKSKEGLTGVCGSLYIYLLNKLHNVPLKFMAGGEIDFASLDKNVSTLGGRDFILQGKGCGCIIEANNELIPLGGES